MAVRPRGDGFQADFTHGGNRYREQFPTHQEALQWEADSKAALIAGRPMPTPRTGAQRGGEITWGELRKKTIAKYWVGTKNEEAASRNAQDAVDFFGANTAVHTTDAAKVDDYVTHLQERKLSGATINRRLATVSKMLRYAHRVGAVKVRPIIERQKEGEGRERYLREPEAEALLKTFEHWGLEEERLFTEFLLYTGARLSEAERVRPIDLATAFKARGAKPDRVTLGAKGSKNGEWRVVPLTKALGEKLAQRMIGDPMAPLFNVNRATYTGHYRKVVDHLKLGDDVVIHTLRHTCASWLVQRGVDLRRVQIWMGHKSIQTTLRYAKLAPTSLFEAVQVFDRHPANDIREAA